MAGENVACRMSRRTFVAGTAGIAALAAGAGVGSAIADEKAGSQDETPADPWAIEDLGEPTETLECEVCVLGAGGTGLAAAIQATQLGLNVIVLEKQGVTGGSFIGTEGLFAVGSHWQAEAGESFTADEVILECMDYHHWIPDPELYEEFFTRTAETVDWLEELGVEFDHVQSLGDSHVCWHVYKGNGAEGTGVTFMQSFSAAAENLGIDIELNCAGKKLIMDNGAVAGVLAVRGDGTVVQVNCPVVIVGTGGYANNGDIIRDLNGCDPSRITASGMSGRDADGLKLMRDAGAVLAAQPGTIMFYGPILPGTSYGSQIQAATSMQPQLWVNQDAQRFVNENMFLQNFAYAGNAVHNQKRVLNVCNQALLDRYATEGPDVGVGVYVNIGDPLTELPDQLAEAMESEESAPYIFKADTIEELATAAGLDPDALKQTVDTYNSYCENGVDERFAKPSEYLHAIDEGPFYAFEVFNGYFTTVGGIKVDTKTEVLGADDAVIPGLYAGGSDAGGLYGDTYDVGIAAGSQASWAINSGRLAAKNAARYLGHEVEE